MRQLELYKNAQAAVASLEPAFIVNKQAIVPGFSAKPSEPNRTAIKENPPQNIIEKFFSTQRQEPSRQVPRFMYPVNIGWGETAPKIESYPQVKGSNAATVTGRFYIWQKQDEAGRIVELQADNAVIFYSNPQAKGEPNNQLSLLGQGGELSRFILRAIVF